jgi:hypothetical protein
VERRATCFNKTQDVGECDWAGPSWPYETSRVLTGLARFMIDYPRGQSQAAGLNHSHYTRLLKSYAFGMVHGSAVNGSQPWVGENIEPDKGFWIARSVMYRGGDGAIDVDKPWQPVSENMNIKRVNCSACEGTCYDRGWASDGKKCTTMPKAKAMSIGPCDASCSCVPPTPSYDYQTHSRAPCCDFKDSCDGKRMPTRDRDRGKDYNHSSFLDLIIEGLVGIRAVFGKRLVIEPLADESVGYFALDNLAYHNHNLSVIWDPDGSQWPHAGCKGLCAFVDGKVANQTPGLSRLELQLP